MVDKIKFFTELDALGRNKVKDKVTQYAFRKKELSLVQEWFCLEPLRDFKTWVYHPLKQGKIVMFSEAIDLYQKGWTDAPRKYPPGVRAHWYKIIIYFRPKKSAFNTFWINNREKVYVGVLIGVLSGTLMFFTNYLLGNFIKSDPSTAAPQQSAPQLKSQQTNTNTTENPKPSLPIKQPNVKNKKN
ncbi:MAG TPA: hypothetical protein DIS62_06945 [Candidatus Kerfeldbacteria bacterium]|nr:hypothetical protein [Candidatus Kerfeldbacteria bacterium]